MLQFTLVIGTVSTSILLVGSNMPLNYSAAEGKWMMTGHTSSKRIEHDVRKAPGRSPAMQVMRRRDAGYLPGWYGVIGRRK